MRFKIDWASLIVGRKFTVFALYLRAMSKYIIYLEGRISGGAYFRNFKVGAANLKVLLPMLRLGFGGCRSFPLLVA